ncbi:MAG: MBL fold metallo-hydrolase [Oscillospiraceae bacterium]|nr:MBL fold metallo-hydrolase [Oscillospiraceae bacterium]
MEVTFLGHCGFAVDLGAQVLVFDYCPRFFKEEARELLLGLLHGRAPVIFVSHRHGDHFAEEIYDLPARLYVLGEGVPARNGAVTMPCGETRNFGELEVTAYRSTDEGAAFLVRAEGVVVYHAGDLNWWHWESEPDPWNPDMEAAFRREVAPVLEEPIDLAFLTADPRQEAAWLWGFDYQMRGGKMRYAIPMHFWNRKSIPARVRNAPTSAPYRDRILSLSALGDRVTVPAGPRSDAGNPD